MTPRIQLASLLLALLTLAACGGGGSGTSSTDAAAAPDPTASEAAPQDSAPEGSKSMADALAGDWEACYALYGMPVMSSFEETHLTRISDTQFSAESKITDTYGTDCAGEVVSTHVETAVVTLTGPVSVWDPVSKRSVQAERYEGVAADNRAFKLLFSITEGDLLRFGNGGDRGPDGYPRSLKETSYGRK